MNENAEIVRKDVEVNGIDGIIFLASKSLKAAEGTGKLGVGELKKCLMFAFSCHLAFEKSMADGKINLKDLPNAYDPALKLIPAVGAAPAAFKEALDIDTSEKEKLKVWAATNYDIADDKLEEKIEGGLSIVIELAHFLGIVF